MISETILEKLRPSNSYIIRPTEKTLSKLTKSQNNPKRHDEDEKKQQELSKFKDTLLSINTSQKSEVQSSRDYKYGKRILLKSIKGGPLIPLNKCGTSRQITPPLISQSLPLLKLKTISSSQQRPQENHHQKQSSISKSQMNNQQLSQIVEQQEIVKQNDEQNSENNQQIDIQQQQNQTEVQGEDDLPSQVLSEQEHIQCLVEQHLSEQEAFVRHLAGKCICVQCPCGRCKCKFQYKPFQTNLCWNSNYRSSYRENPIKEQDLKVDLEQFKKFKSVEPCEYKTTMASDFKPYEVAAPETKQQKAYQPAYGTTPMSSYKNFYMNYGDLHYQQFKQSHYKTVIPELPFNPNTTYKQSFRQQELQNNAFTKPPNGKPFPTIDLFLGESQCKQAYQPKKADKVKPQDQHGEIIQVPAYQGQYTSVTHNDFVKKEIPCSRYK